MDLKASSLFPANGRHSLDSDSGFYFNGKSNPFADSFPDPLCRLNLKETSDFVKALPVTTPRGLLEISSQRRDRSRLMGQKSLETPSTPGRPLFSFSPVHLHRKNIPSKWDDAEKWLIGSSCHESPAHVAKPTKHSRKDDSLIEKKVSVVEKKAPSSIIQTFDGPILCMDTDLSFHRTSSEVILKDKTTNNVEQIYPTARHPESSTEGFVLKSLDFEVKKDAEIAGTLEVQRRDIGTEMTPLESSMTTRCHTPIKSSSPARHNTPTDMSGPLIPSSTRINVSELTDCRFDKLNLCIQDESITSNWRSREEEEAELSKSLRHLDISSGRKSLGISRASAWMKEERSKSCIRYQREEAKIQAWLNLENAKAEAESRKLEVKIQTMRSNLEEKLMKRMDIVQRRAEEWRAAAQLRHSQQLKRAPEHAQKIKKNKKSCHFSIETACGCLPCKNHL